MYIEPTDQRMMCELAAGADARLADLMQRWQNRVLGYIERMCGPGRGDDAYQEVWTRLYLYRKSYDRSRPFRPFLFAIVVNCCRTALFNASCSKALSLDAGESPLDVPGHDGAPDRALLAAEEVQRLYQAVAMLPEAQREVVLLYLLLDSDYGQIAQVLGKSVGTVRTNMHYAVRTLRSRLEALSAAREKQSEIHP